MINFLKFCGIAYLALGVLKIASPTNEADLGAWFLVSVVLIYGAGIAIIFSAVRGIIRSMCGEYRSR